jgi:hypothetical protein
MPQGSANPYVYTHGDAGAQRKAWDVQQSGRGRQTLGSGEVDRDSTQPNEEVRIATPASSPKTKKGELRVTGNGRSCGNGLETFFPKRITNRLAPHGNDGHE